MKKKVIVRDELGGLTEYLVDMDKIKAEIKDEIIKNMPYVRKEIKEEIDQGLQPVAIVSGIAYAALLIFIYKRTKNKK